MSWLRRAYLTVLPALCLNIAFAATVEENAQVPDSTRTIKIVSGPHYPPFSADHLPDHGLGPFLVSKVFEATGSNVVSGFRPWKRAYRETLQHKYDAVLPYTATPDRLRDFLFSVPVFKVEAFIYVRSDSGINAQSLSELKGRKYCNPLGFADGEPLARMESEGNLTRLSPATLENCFNMLQAGRVDFIKTNPHVAEYMIRNHDFPSEKIHALPFIVETAFLHVMAPRAHSGGKALIETFNRSFESMKASGQIRELTRRYLKRVEALGELPLSNLD